MSQENLAFVHRFYQAWNHGDLDEIAAMYPDGFVADLSRRKLDPEVLRGAEEGRSFLENWRQLWDSYANVLERVTEVGDQVLLFVLVTARGRGSGVPVHAMVAHVWTFRDGVPVRCDYYPERAQALEAVGLKE